MGRALYVLRNVLVCVCAGLVIGFFTMSAVWLFSSPKPTAEKSFEILKVSACAAALTVAVVKVICGIAQQHPINKAIKLAMYDETSEKAFSVMNDYIRKTKDSERKNTARLILSALYTENGRNEEALAALGSIDFVSLPEEMGQEYFNAALYTYLLSGDLKNADKVMEDASPYFKDPAPSVMHTLGVYEYAHGRFGRARSYLLRSKAADDSERNICDCDLYLALCALKEGRLDEAKALKTEAGEFSVTSEEQREIIKLEHLISRVEEIKNKENTDAEIIDNDDKEITRT